MTRYLRVTDSVKPRREYTITEHQLCDDHTMLDKSPFMPDGCTPLPPKYTPDALGSGVSVSPPSSSAPKGADSKKEK